MKRPAEDLSNAEEAEKTNVAAALVARADKVFPGNKWTRGPLQEPWSKGDPSFPKFLSRGEGCRVWDVDGREFIDYHCGFGANVLGYGDQRVEAAAAAAAKEAGGQLLSGPTKFSVELAERLVALRPAATWALFAKNGTDATTMARVVARAATGKKFVLRERHGATFSYHGASPQWCRDKKGVSAEESSQLEATFVYNNLESVKEAITSCGGDVAAIFVGGCSYPYSMPTQEPTAEFAQGVRALANAHGALLVLDEIRTNFRVGGGVGASSWSELGDCAPDLHCVCKALANGHPLAALLGAETARKGAAEIFATGTYWIGAPPMAAALATLDALEADDSAAMRHMQRMGRRLADGLVAAAKSKGLSCTVSGPPAMPFLTFDDERPHDRPKGVRWCAAMAAQGVWCHPHHNWYLCASHTEDDIDLTLRAAESAFAAVATAAV